MATDVISVIVCVAACVAPLVDTLTLDALEVVALIALLVPRSASAEIAVASEDTELFKSVNNCFCVSRVDCCD